MRILITGANGQLGRALQQALDGYEILPLAHADLDVSDRQAVLALAAWEPDLIIHAAAMTNVDGCELDPERWVRSM